jgi:citrate lyase subunit beta/citryl-CoA lyase
LYVPGNKLEWMEKATSYAADALILDLEDSVPTAEKARAREMVASVIRRLGGANTLLVRINSLTSSEVLADLLAVVRPGLAGVVVPKVEGPEDVVFVSRLLGWLEFDQKMAPGTVIISPVLETAAGIRQAYAIGMASERIAYMGGIGVPGGDVERALGYRWTSEGTETFVLRSQVLLDARAAGCPNPITGLWTDIADLDGLRAFAEQGRSLGYEGMAAIHPSHISVINEVFTPTAEDLDYYRGLLDAMDVAQVEGVSAITYRGVMVDTAMVKTARARLEMANIRR